MKKNICIIIGFIIIFAFFPIISQADGEEELKQWDVSNFNTITKDSTAFGKTTTKKVLGTGIQVMKIVGVTVAIVMLTVLGMKYMSVAPSEKADFKKSAVAYLVGVCILFSMSGIIQIIELFATSNL